MNQILLSFLCGAAFIGGATAVLVMLSVWKSMCDKKTRDELYGYWQQSIASHQKQVEVLIAIANTIKERR